MKMGTDNLGNTIDLDFEDTIRDTLKDIRKRVFGAFAQGKMTLTERDSLLGSIEKIRQQLPYTKNFLGSPEVIMVVKKLMGELFIKVNNYESKKEGEIEMSRKNRNKHRRQKEQERDIAEEGNYGYGYGDYYYGRGGYNGGYHGGSPAVYDTSRKEMTSVKMNDLKPTETENITVKSGTPKIDRFVNSPVIYILPEVYHKMMTWTSLLDDEITGLGTVEELGEGKFLIDSMYLFDQKVSKARCEATGPMSLIDLCERMEKDGKNPSKMKVWWHSHNTMGVSPSQQDDETGRNYCANGFLISLITNHNGEIYSKMNIYKPLDMIIDNIPVIRLDPGISKEFIDQCKAEIEKYVKTESTVYYSSGPVVQPESKLDVVVSGNHTDTLKTPLEQAREQLNAQKPAPTEWGEDWVENGIRYIWDRTEEKFNMFCATTGAVITEDEVAGFGGTNYNEFLVDGDTPPSTIYGE